MARRTPQLTAAILAAAWMLISPSIQANEPPQPPPAGPPSPTADSPPPRGLDAFSPPPRSPKPFLKDNRGNRPHRKPNSHHQAKRFEKLIAEAPPEKRKALEKQYSAWKTLSAEKKESLRRNHIKASQRLSKESDKALKKLGLTDLPKQRKQEFRKQYIKERKQLERDLRTEMQQQRKKRLPELMKKLKVEFTSVATPVSPQP